MMRRALCLGFVSLLVTVGCESPSDPSGTPPPAAAPAAQAPAKPAAVSGGRTITDAAKAAMKGALAAETSAQKVWIYSQPGNPEVAALVAALSGVFKDAGWGVTSESASGISLKPGLVTLIAEEQYPPYVDTVLKALDASGIENKSAAGYRSYAEEMKGKNPSWPGVPIRADQDFVIVVGPKPAA
jgi:hypothetical protein